MFVVSLGLQADSRGSSWRQQTHAEQCTRSSWKLCSVSCVSPEEPLKRILDYLVSLGRHLVAVLDTQLGGQRHSRCRLAFN